MNLINTNQILSKARNTAIIGYTVLVAVVKELRKTFALNTLETFFDNDAHHIVSKRGWEVLNNKENGR